MIARAILSITALLLITPALVSACACSQAPPGQCPGLRSDDVVFLGTVTGAEQIANAAPEPDASAAPADAAPKTDASGGAVEAASSPLVRYHFHIDERFAGPQSSEIDVFSGGDDGDCVFRFSLVRSTSSTRSRRPKAAFSPPFAMARVQRSRPVRFAATAGHGQGQHVASVFGVLHRTDPPSGSGRRPLRPAREYSLEAAIVRRSLPNEHRPRRRLYLLRCPCWPIYFLRGLTRSHGTQPEDAHRRSAALQDPNNACYEYDVDALPTGHIHGSVLGPGKPLGVASVELYRAGAYQDSRPGLWSFQGSKGVSTSITSGRADTLVVFNRTNRVDPNSPFPRASIRELPT